VRTLRILATAVAALLAAAPVRAQGTPADSAAIRATALDYALGWYAADGERMSRSLHPELAKRRVTTDAQGVSRLTQRGAMTLAPATARGGGRDTPAEQRRADVAILDLFQATASVRVDMNGWIDYMHMARWNGRWVVVNVLWEDRRP
jgi:hypothetical protein